MNNYSSYLVRHWLIAGDASKKLSEETNNQFQVFDIEHVQSGRRTRVQDLNDARAWIESLSSEGVNQISEDDSRRGS